jgi:hypothetical protein
VQVEASAPRELRDARLALAVYAAAGGVALGYEVVWSELLVQFTSTRSYALAAMLATYLSGLALGSGLFTRFGGCGQYPWRTLGVLLGAAGTSALAIVALLGQWLLDAQTFAGMWAMRATGSETAEVAARFVVAASVVDHPLIEDAAWVRRGELQRVLPRLLALATDVPLRADDRRRPAAEAERRELLAFYRFSLHALAGEPDEAGAALREVLAHDSKNPYYLWVAYGRR